MRGTIAFLICALLLLVSACSGGGTPAYTKFQSVPLSGWSRDFPLEFDLSEDSLLCDGRIFDLALVVRNTERCNLRNLWLAVETVSFDSQLRRDTISIPLCDSIGRWTGIGGHGIYESSAILRRLKIPEGMIITVSHADTALKVKGISDVGVILLPVEKSNLKKVLPKNKNKK